MFYGNTAPQLPWDTSPHEKRLLTAAFTLGILLFLMLALWVNLTPQVRPPKLLPDHSIEPVATWLMPEATPEEVMPTEPLPEPKEAVPVEAPKQQPQDRVTNKATQATPPSPEAAAKKRVRQHTQALEALDALEDALPQGPSTLRRPTSPNRRTESTNTRLEQRQQASSKRVQDEPASRTGAVESSQRVLEATEQRQAQAPSTQAPTSAKAEPQTPTRGTRTDAEVRRVFDAQAGRFNSIYQRALRSQPTLQGEVVVALTVAPSGEVTQARILRSSLKDAAMEERILLIVRHMKFEAREVDTWEGSYPINFFPH